MPLSLAPVVQQQSWGRNGLSSFANNPARLCCREINIARQSREGAALQEVARPGENTVVFVHVHSHPHLFPNHPQPQEGICCPLMVMRPHTLSPEPLPPRPSKCAGDSSR